MVRSEQGSTQNILVVDDSEPRRALARSAPGADERAVTELRERCDLLERQRDELLRIQLQRDRLMAFIVHDLKNPVSSMDLCAQVLLQDPGLSEDSRSWASQIRAEAQQLARMIVNLLDLRKAGEGKLVPRRSRIDLRGLVVGVVAEQEAGARQRGVTLASQIHGGSPLVDEDLLRRLLANLVDNAVRHAPPSSTVAVSAGEDAGQLTIRVVDAGDGVPHEMRERIFEPFFQLGGPDCSATRGGRGLGLTFCKLAAEAHGGRIWVEDGAPGTVFVVSLPGAADPSTP